MSERTHHPDVTNVPRDTPTTTDAATTTGTPPPSGAGPGAGDTAPDAPDAPDAPAPPSGRLARGVRLLAMIGPAFVVGSWQFGPGALTAAVQAGSGYGYALIWVVVLCNLLMLAFADMSIRVGIMSGTSLIATIKQYCGALVAKLSGVGLFVITLMFSVGNAVGSGLGLSLLFGGSVIWWSLACTALVACVLLARRLYRAIEKALLAVVATMALSFVVTAFLSGPEWSAAGEGFIPSLPAGAGLLIVAMVGTNFSMNAAFFASYASRERGLKREQYRQTTIVDTIPGIVAPGIMTVLVLITAATVLGGNGEEASFGDLAGVLEPVAGEAGRIIFALGFFGAAFSSMLANATAGSTVLADAFGWAREVSALPVRLGILGILAFGAAVTVIAGSSPVQLIIIAQALTVLVKPLLGVVLLVLANNRTLMGPLGNAWWQNVCGAAGVLLVVGTSIHLALNLY
ncbi:Nramp family divalent metal transporter [Streptomyces otsuchiensis]|uniref:Nramp family divalent metal transporter n=1 Tax=Streptomyces otsuchiensis TaxID=2681388 RepID=UPI001D130FEC|nr:Nramp family divalent metal transporter [Streptomyces otsuchiensis]